MWTSRVLQRTESDSWRAGRGSFDGVNAHHQLSIRSPHHLRQGRLVFLRLDAQQRPRLRLKLLETPPLGLLDLLLRWRPSRRRNRQLVGLVLINGQLDSRLSRRRRRRAEDLLLLLAVAGLDGDLGVELALVLLDDAVVPVAGLAGLEDLEFAPVGVLVGRVAVRLVPPPSRHGCCCCGRCWSELGAHSIFISSTPDPALHFHFLL